MGERQFLRPRTSQSKQQRTVGAWRTCCRVDKVSRKNSRGDSSGFLVWPLPTRATYATGYTGCLTFDTYLPITFCLFGVVGLLARVAL